jgi:hypothetical protein
VISCFLVGEVRSSAELYATLYSRTFASNVFFGGDGVGCQKLRRLLTAFAAYDPSIGGFTNGPPLHITC